MQQTKPAAIDGGHREIIIAAWRPLPKNTLVGFFTATLSCGLVLRDLMLHESHGKRWIGFSAREWIDEQGERQYASFVGFIDRPTADRFRIDVLSALDRYREAL